MDFNGLIPMLNCFQHLGLRNILKSVFKNSNKVNRTTRKSNNYTYTWHQLAQNTAHRSCGVSHMNHFAPFVQLLEVKKIQTIRKGKKIQTILSKNAICKNISNISFHSYTFQIIQKNLLEHKDQPTIVNLQSDLHQLQLIRKHFREQPTQSLTSTGSAGASMSLPPAQVHPSRPGAFPSLGVFGGRREMKLFMLAKGAGELLPDPEDPGVLPVEAAKVQKEVVEFWF